MQRSVKIAYGYFCDGYGRSVDVGFQNKCIGALQTFDPSFRIAENNLAGSNPNNVPELYIRGRSGIGLLSWMRKAFLKHHEEQS